ncbi:potassium voltage-gated channel subfamily H member 4 [Platysternon megacephalum]|uniref:Potassium voltage-gated channel subfamily H member 4 n=1 Tax=Platysternon megacephalum TaxID=55544 RepID=A0A4D9DJS9_9SAUR|nr:potassium voltage-gated channel subfamily H member 4 [Platysternon megacephalum]
MGPLQGLCLRFPPPCRGLAISCYNCTSSEGYNCTTNQATCTGAVNSCITIARDEEQGGAISCYNCTSSEGYNCTTNQATCTGAVNSCITIARDEEQGDEDKEKTVYEKKCNSDDRLCNQFYGLTAGAYRLRWNSTCCRADSCNPSSGVPNGLRCRSCFARGSDVCVPTEVLNCTGLQTSCMQFAATAGAGFEGLRVAFMGCATRSLCDVGAVALFASQRQAVLKTNLCSAAGAARGGLPLLSLGGLLLWALRP